MGIGGHTGTIAARSLARGVISVAGPRLKASPELELARLLKGRLVSWGRGPSYSLCVQFHSSLGKGVSSIYLLAPEVDVVAFPLVPFLGKGKDIVQVD